MKIGKLCVLFCALFFLAACQPEVVEREFPGRILLIGDSFTAEMDEIIVGLASAAHPEENIEASAMWVGGTTLQGHWLSQGVHIKINEEAWTTVVLQEDLSLEGSIESFYEHTRLFHDEIMNAGAETILFMPWEYAVSDSKTIESIADAYKTIGDELGLKVAPVGLAWARSLEERPDFNLYAGDQSHSNIRGGYLTSLVLYATIFEQSPEGIPFPPPSLLAELDANESMSDEDISYLQQLAWASVEEFQSLR